MEKRQILFFLLAGGVLVAWSYFFAPAPRPRPPAPKPLVKKEEAKPPTTAQDDQKNAEQKTASAAEKPVPLREDLTLGEPDSDEFHIFARLTNRGAAVRHLVLNQFKDETRKNPFVLLTEETPGFDSFLVSLGKNDAEKLSTKNWEVVEAGPGRIVFRTAAMGGRIQVEKRYSLAPGEDVIRLEIAFKNRTKELVEDVRYELTGGNGLPIEGKWFTYFFRKLVGVLTPTGGGYPILVEEEAKDVAEAFASGRSPRLYAQTPVQFMGVECQYFASLVVQKPMAMSERLIASAQAEDLDFLAGRRKEPQLHNVTVRLTSVPITLGADREIVHEYLLYNGPKKESALAAYSEYHLPMLIRYASFLFIPIGSVARVMVYILNTLHGFVGDYGLSIILLTVLVRTCMFPLSFRQAKSMQKMQALQPKMQELKEKYANDKEKLNRAVMDLYQKENVNPVAGCLPLFLQLPVFVGLYQSLYSSFSLRQSSFLWDMTWIKDLSAPDQLFPFGIDVWQLGPYFNLLPVIAVIQMVLQAMYMSPPATTPEAQMQKRMMTFMMIFFGFFFYKVPAGLCVYIITSGSWSMLERQFLPKNPALAGAPGRTALPAVATPAATASNDGASWKTPVSDKKRGKSRR